MFSRDEHFHDWETIFTKLDSETGIYHETEQCKVCGLCQFHTTKFGKKRVKT